MAETSAAAEIVRALSLLALLVWSALVSMDERALGPLGLHQPLVAAAGAGAVLGCAELGVACGVVLQLLWMGLRPIGGRLEPDVGAAAIVSTGWLAGMAGPGGGSGGNGETALAEGAGFLGVLAFVPVAVAALGAAAVGSWAEARILRERNARREGRLLERNGDRDGDGEGDSGGVDKDSIIERARACVVQGLAEAGLRGMAILLLLVLLPSALGLPQAVGAVGAVAGLRGAPAEAGSGLAMAPGAVVAILTAILAAAGLLRTTRSAALPTGRTAARVKPQQRPADWRERDSAACGRVPEMPRFGYPASLRAMVWRLLLLQASFNARGRQRAGFLWAVGQEWRKLSAQVIGRGAACRARRGGTVLLSKAAQSLGELRVPFNTNPLWAPLVAAGFLRLKYQGLLRAEELETNGLPDFHAAPQAEVYSGTLASFLGATGDLLVWENIRPLCLLTGVSAAVAIGYFSGEVMSPAGAWLFLAFWLMVQALLRERAARLGWEAPLEAPKHVHVTVQQRLLPPLARLRVLLAWFVLILLVVRLGVFATGHSRAWSVVAGAGIMALIGWVGAPRAIARPILWAGLAFLAAIILTVGLVIAFAGAAG